MKNVNNSSKFIFKHSKHIQKAVGIAVFSALAVVVAYVCNVIPAVAGFLSLDVKDAVIAIAAFIYGPISGVAIAFIEAFIEFITFSTTGWYGFVMNFASSAVFSLTAAVIYKFKRTQNGALIGLLSAVISTTGVMLLLNNFVTPIYLVEFIGMPETVATQTVIDMLPTVLFPFNLAKTLLNTGLTVFLYKPITRALRHTGLVVSKTKNENSNLKVIMLVFGAVALAVAATVLVIIW